jgi:hypothetical protein
VFRADKPFRDVFELAAAMIPLRGWNGAMDNGAMNDQETLAKLMNLDMDLNTPLTFASAEDTCILRVETDVDSYLVASSCYNHRFNELDGALNGYPSDLTRELKRLADENPIQRFNGKKESSWDDCVFEWIECNLDDVSEYWSIEQGRFVPKGWNRWDEEFERREARTKAATMARRIAILPSRARSLTTE